MDMDIIDEMNLPFSNPNIELETISRYKLKPLFDTKYFIVRDENERDNGIDLHVEILNNNRVTNFRFAIQLKATESTDFNKDGSFSLSLSTSNINYLMNNGGMPSYYILYSKSNDTFYYEDLNSFISELNQKNINWDKQKTNTLKFIKKLTSDSIIEIYETTKRRGISQRKITEKHIQLSSTISTDDIIHIDKNLNISSDTEIRKLIENGGFHLINEGRWLEIIKLHEKASNNINSTSIYNVILGVSYYNSGDLINAYSLFKKAKQINSELKEEIKQYLQYYIYSTKYSLALITEEEYYLEVNKIDSGSFFYPYTQLEKIKYNFTLKDYHTDEDYQNLLSDINIIINNPKNDFNVKMCAKIEYIFYLGSFLNMAFFKRICHMNANPILFTSEQRTNEAKKFIGDFKKINIQYILIEKENLEHENMFNHFISKNNYIKFNYELDFMSSYLINKTTKVSVKLDSDKKNQFEGYIEELDKACDFYEKVGHVQNLNVILSTKYELFKYLEEEDQAIIVKNKIKDNIEIYELNEQKKRFDFLVNEGTSHEAFAKFINDIETKNKANLAKYEEMKKELVLIDSSEVSSEKLKYENSYQINLFPFGYFKFPKNKIDLVYEILNISESAKPNFLFMFENSIIPTANTYYKLINKEGPQEGNLALKTFESFENMYRIRKAFYENKFYRIEMK